MPTYKEYYFECCRQKRGGTYIRDKGFDFTCAQCGFRIQEVPDKDGKMILRTFPATEIIIPDIEDRLNKDV